MTWQSVGVLLLGYRSSNHCQHRLEPASCCHARLTIRAVSTTTAAADEICIQLVGISDRELRGQHESGKHFIFLMKEFCSFEVLNVCHVRIVFPRKWKGWASEKAEIEVYNDKGCRRWYIGKLQCTNRRIVPIYALIKIADD